MNKPILPLVAVTAAMSFAHAFAGQSWQAELQAQSKIGKAQATRIALAKVLHAKVKSAELEREGGHLVWSCDLAERGRSGAAEVQIDAMNGKVVSLKRETAAQESLEASHEARGK